MDPFQPEPSYHLNCPPWVMISAHQVLEHHIQPWPSPRRNWELWRAPGPAGSHSYSKKINPGASAKSRHPLKLGWDAVECLPHTAWLPCSSITGSRTWNHPRIQKWRSLKQPLPALAPAHCCSSLVLPWAQAWTGCREFWAQERWNNSINNNNKNSKINNNNNNNSKNNSKNNGNCCCCYCCCCYTQYYYN